MNICVVSPSYPTNKTIVFVFVDQLVRAFADEGNNVTVIAPQSLTRWLLHGDPLVKSHSTIVSKKGSRIDLYRPRYISLGNGRFDKWTRKFFKRAVLRGYKKNKIKPDVLYGHFWSSIASLLPISIKHGLPLFGASGEENVAFYDKFSEKEKSELREHINGLISVSSKNRNECISLELIDNAKVRVIPNAVDLDLFKTNGKMACREALGIYPNSFVVGFMGQFVSRKGTLRLDQALKRIGDSDIKAMFIGSGAEEPTYENIIFKGRLEHDSIPKYLTACDVFVLPTENEGCSNAIVEALACGIPVISTDAPFNYDILNGNNSIMIDCHDVDQIAESILKLKDNILLRERLSKGAKEKASELSLGQRAKRILTFIQENK